MIKFENVFLRHNKHFDTLNNININIEKNDKIVILGDSDSGKNSFVRLVVGLEKPTSGTIFINSSTVDKTDFKNDINVGFLSSKPVFLNRKTVKQNLEYVLSIREESFDNIGILVQEVLKKFELQHIVETKIKALKMYEKTIVAIARLYLRDLDLLLLEDVFELRNLDLNRKKSFGKKKKDDFDKALNLVYSDDEINFIKTKLDILIDKNKDATIVLCDNNDIFAINNNFKVVKLKYGSIE